MSLLVIAGAILLHGFALSQTTVAPTDELLLDRGAISNGTYTNECFGLTFLIPQGWEVNTIPGLAPGKALHLPGGSLGLLTINRHHEQSLGDSIVLSAHDMSKHPTRTVPDFVSGAAQGQVNTDPQKREMIRDAVPVKYGGKQFYRADYKQSMSSGSTLYVAFVYAKLGEYFVGETVMATSPEALNEATDSLHQLSLRRDLPNPSCVLGPNDGPMTGVIGSVQSSGLSPTSRVHVSQMVSQALLIKRVPPEYPDTARQGHVEGTVVVDTMIDANGDVEDAHAISGPPQLAVAAVDAVRQWKFKPYTINGHPMKIETPASVVFQLAPNP